MYLCLADDNGIECSALCDDALWALHHDALIAKAALRNFDLLTYPTGEGLHMSARLGTLAGALAWIEDSTYWR